jgi:hypothetical protein
MQAHKTGARARLRANQLLHDGVGGAEFEKLEQSGPT